MCKGDTDVEKPSTSSIVQKEHKRIELVKTEDNIEFQPVSSSPSQKSPTQSDTTVVHSIDQVTLSASVMVSGGFSFCCDFMTCAVAGREATSIVQHWQEISNRYCPRTKPVIGSSSAAIKI